jgi:hypothetical protein
MLLNAVLDTADSSVRSPKIERRRDLPLKRSRSDKKS